MTKGPTRLHSSPSSARRRCKLNFQWLDLCEPALSFCHSILFLHNHRCHVPGTNCLSVHPGFEIITITLEFYVARIPKGCKHQVDFSHSEGEKSGRNLYR